MSISRTTKRAFIFAFNCWSLLAWLIWQGLPEPDKQAEFAICNFGAPPRPEDILALGFLALMTGITIAPFLMLWREKFADLRSPELFGLNKH